MFTGIIQEVGRVIEAKPQGAEGSGAGLRVRIESRFDDLKLGESVAVNGVCLTVAELPSPTHADFYLSSETLARSNLGALAAGSKINLERALLASDRLSGHIVQGHVDGVGQVHAITPSGESHELEFTIPRQLGRYLVEKGSITVNGVSLTINRLGENRFAVMLIPHTWTHTNLSDLKIGAPVNVEVDVLAKYVAALVAPYQADSGADSMESLCQP